jgi:L-Ala-D/L-Glu epimerase
MSLRLEMRDSRLQLRAPLGTSRARQVDVQGLALLVRDTEGGFGLGEVTPLSDFGTETLSDAKRVLASLRLGPAPQTVQDVTLALAPLADFRAARAGVEMALLDLLARRLGVPVAKLLGAGSIHAVPVNALLRGETPAEAAAEAAQAVADGFGTLKLKVGGGSAALDAARLEAVRSAVGPSTRLRVDANAAWTEAEAWLRLPPLAAVGLEYVEQPVGAKDIEGLRRLRRLLRVAADEALADAGATAMLLDGEAGPAADVFILKLPVLGGVLPALALARRARTCGVGAVVTSAMDGAVARAAAAHLALALDGEWAHGLATGALLCEDPGAHPVAHGALQLQDVPGLGILREAVGW